MQVLIARSALKALRKMQPAKAKDLREAIARAAVDPLAPDHNRKPLKGIPHGYRIGVGDWRVSYVLDVASRTLKVFEIAPRGGACR